nr:PREDICTED: myelin and lymphocyte protein-like [Equus przewalskii]
MDGRTLPSGFAVFTTFPERPPGSAEQASGQRGAGAPRVLSRHISQHAAMDGRTLPSGFAVFTTFPELLFIFELVFGGLVWMLITSSQLPNPLVQGWVTFVSVFCFIGTGALLFLYLTGAHGGETSWVSLESAYHTVAVLLYSIASILEILATIYMQDGFTYEHYLENISAVVFSCIASLLYMAHVVFV